MYSQRFSDSAGRFCAISVAVVSLALGTERIGAQVADSNGAKSAVADKPADLKAEFAKVLTAIRAKDTTQAAKLTRDFLPDDQSLRKAVTGEDAIKIITAFHQQFRSAPDAQVSWAFAVDPDQTEIFVHGSTTKDLADYKNDSVAFREFPGGARAAAQQGILKPGMTFYEIEVLKPGAELGMKFHLFYHDGKNWKMLGPIWRAMRDSSPPEQVTPVDDEPDEESSRGPSEKNEGPEDDDG